ncbi:unnamed protein product [Trichogramma brassicae]|uniref:Major facilitator superfamily (MFS) profile domain-containing protein n=1 Tax=Trichogramma brassicae TaxID=86971 RepID=A0A6H5INQ0_9HYME|nr:unnamed protein product [Trichogramma brassicae]
MSKWNVCAQTIVISIFHVFAYNYNFSSSSSRPYVVRSQTNQTEEQFKNKKKIKDKNKAGEKVPKRDAQHTQTQVLRDAGPGRAHPAHTTARLVRRRAALRRRLRPLPVLAAGRSAALRHQLLHSVLLADISDAGAREHWCRVDELLGPYPSPEDRRKIAVPTNDKYPYYDTCSRWDLNFSAILGQTTIEPNSSLWQSVTNNRTVKCDRWEYDFTQIPYPSIGAETGYAIGATSSPRLRRSSTRARSWAASCSAGLPTTRAAYPALWLCTACGVAGSIATASADSFWSFALCRFVTGLAFDNVISIPLIIGKKKKQSIWNHRALLRFDRNHLNRTYYVSLKYLVLAVVEYMGVSRRTVVVNIAFGLYFGVGSTLLPWLAYYIADWRLLSYVSAAPLAFCLVTPWILPESARWYVSNRRSDKVIEKLKRIASVNDVRPDPHFYDVFYRNLSAKEGKKETATLLDLFRTPRLARITIILTLFWSLILLAFDGHVYSLKLLESSVFLSFSLACATELPAALLLTMVLDRWGRRFCGFVTMALTTAFTIAEILVESGTWKLVMSIFARFTLNMAANVGLQYAAELLPTPVRAQGVGMIHIFGILAHSVAPYIIDTVEWWSDMPMAIISAIAFLCASLVLFLPETLGHDLPQTLQQGEDFGKNQRFWSSPCCGSCYANDDDDDDQHNDGVKGDTYQINDIRANDVGKVADNVNQRYSLSSNDGGQHLGGVLKTDVGRYVDTETRENSHRHGPCTCERERNSKSDEGEDAAEHHGEEAHPAPAPSVEEEGENEGGRQLGDGGQRERREHVRVQKFHVPDVAVEHHDHYQPVLRATK